jgi:CheY-like chemotaxis protein
VEAHNGMIDAHSAGLGCGANFIVRLPVAISRAGQMPALGPAAVAPASEDTILDGISVLVVDDDSSCREVVSAQLQQSGARVITAASAAHAVDIVLHEHVDVLLADIGMPGEDGYSLIRRVRSSESPTVASIPAAALTALARREDRQHALQAGFQLHLTKPVDPRSLVSGCRDAPSARRLTCGADLQGPRLDRDRAWIVTTAARLTSPVISTPLPGSAHPREAHRSTLRSDDSPQGVRVRLASRDTRRRESRVHRRVGPQGPPPQPTAT